MPFGELSSIGTTSRPERERPSHNFKPEMRHRSPISFKEMRRLFATIHKLPRETGPGQVYYSICDIPPEGLEGDPYALFRYLDDVSYEMDVGVDKYQLLSKVDDAHFNYLMDSVDLGLRDAYGQTTLHLAAQYLDKKHIERLVNCGCDLEARDKKGYTPFLYAVMADNIDNMEVLRRLNCNYGNKIYTSGRTALHVAAQYGAMRALKHLIKLGLSLDVQDREGLTPIVLASYYSKSDICAFLIEQGASTHLTDNGGVMGLMRIAISMPALTREVLDGLVEKDIYQGEKYFKLGELLGSDPTTNTSFFHYIVWLSNMGIVEHPIIERLVHAKWVGFAGHRFNMEFLLIMLLLTFWTILFLQPHANVYTIDYSTDSLYIIVGTCATCLHGLRILQNVHMLVNRRGYMEFLNKMFSKTYKNELNQLHFKQYEEYQSILKSKFEKKTVTFWEDLSNSPDVLLDFIVDILLTTLLVIKLIVFVIDFRGEVDDFLMQNNRTRAEYRARYQATVNTYTHWVNLFGAVVICTAWISGFTKLAVTENGSFVIYMRTVGKDLLKVGTIFMFVYVPAIVSLYKTIYEGEVAWYEAGFIVIRMVMVDYDYSAGLDASLYPIWWMLASLTWIFLGSIVIMNILIAVMAESYADIMDKSGPLMARMERARCITRFERGMKLETLQKHHQKIHETCSPEIVKFDPVTDRETIDVLREEIGELKIKVNKTEDKINENFRRVEDMLASIVQSLELYAAGSTGSTHY